MSTVTRVGMGRVCLGVALKAAAVVLGVLLAFAVPSPARGQFGMQMDPSEFATPIGRRAMDGYAKLLALDKDQKEMVLSLYEGYNTAYRAAKDEMQKAMRETQEKFQDTRDFTVWQEEFPKKMQALGEKMEAIEKSFLEDVKAILTEPQQEKMPRVERARMRDRTLRVQFISGQGVDLLKLLEQVGADPAKAPGLTEQMERYELDMDRALKAFEKWGKDQQDKQKEMMKLSSDPVAMMKKVDEIMKELGDRSREVRDVNRQYSRTISAILTPEQQAKFDAEFLKRSFPRVYRESYATKAIAAAEKLPDLDADQKERLAGLKTSYQKGLESANKKWASAIEQEEEKAGSAMAAMMKSMMGGGAGDSSVKEAREVRKELDSKTKDRLNDILRPEQRSKLPAEKSEAQNPMEMWGMSISDSDEDEK